METMEGLKIAVSRPSHGRIDPWLLFSPSFSSTASTWAPYIGCLHDVVSRQKSVQLTLAVKPIQITLVNSSFVTQFWSSSQTWLHVILETFSTASRSVNFLHVHFLQLNQISIRTCLTWWWVSTSDNDDYLVKQKMGMESGQWEKMVWVCLCRVGSFVIKLNQYMFGVGGDCEEGTREHNLESDSYSCSCTMICFVKRWKDLIYYGEVKAQRS